MKYLKYIVFVVLGVLIIFLGSNYSKKLDKQAADKLKADQLAEKNAQQKTMENLKIEDIVVGTGKEAKAGDTVTVNYVGTLDNGKKFDSSYDRSQPFEFHLGAGEVIKGWDLGVAGMKVGGKRNLTIPPELGYGDRAVGGVIPANSTLHFTVELLDVK